MPRRPSRQTLPRVDCLESRQLLAAGALLATASQVEIAAAAKKSIKATKTVIYGLVLPARLATTGKYQHGYALVDSNIVWLLDLTAWKSAPAAARAVVSQPAVAYGSAEITQQADGTLKRKFKVTWIELLKDKPIAPAYPRANRGSSH